MEWRPFNPQYGSNQVVVVGASAALNINASSGCVRVVNTGALKGYFRTFEKAAADVTAAAGVATAADCLVMPGMATTVSKSLYHDRIATFSAGGTTFELMTGDGV